MKKRSSPKYASPFAASAAVKRRKAARLIGDRLTVLPSSLLRHCILCLLSFEEWMTDIRQVNHSFRHMAEGMAVQWMNGTFPSALALLNKKTSKAMLKEAGKRRIREWATSTSAFPSAAIDLSDPSKTVVSASFTVNDAVWVNFQVHWWAVSALCNRRVDLSAHQRHLLRVPAAEISSEFHVPQSRLFQLNRGREVEQVVGGRRLSRSYWLVDVLLWVLEEYGHVEPFIAFHKHKKEMALENHRNMQAGRLKNKDPERLKAAMAAEGVDWSQWRWEEHSQRWSTTGIVVWWDCHGYGRWRIGCEWDHNRLCHPQLYLLSKRVHIALRKVGSWCYNCENGYGCHAKRMGWFVKEGKDEEKTEKEESNSSSESVKERKEEEEVKEGKDQIDGTERRALASAVEDVIHIDVDVGGGGDEKEDKREDSAEEEQRAPLPT